MAGLPLQEQSTNLYKPCIECKRKRTICIRARRKINFGHANITVHEQLESGKVHTDTYGLWTTADNAKPGQTDLRHNYEGDDYTKDTDAWNPKDVRCKELDKKGEEALKKAVNKNQQYNFATGNYCST